MGLRRQARATVFPSSRDSRFDRRGPIKRGAKIALICGRFEYRQAINRDLGVKLGRDQMEMRRRMVIRIAMF